MAAPLHWRNLGKPQKTRYISLSNGYHGETLGALAVSGTGLYRDAYAPLLMQPIQVPSPDCFDRSPGEAWEDHTRRRFRHMEEALQKHAGEVAAVIVEPLVQCASGMRMYHPIYLRLLREACTRHGVLLIADEIAVGFGRTGRMFASDWAGITPDLMCLSKGLTAGTLPLAVVMSTDQIYQAFYDDYSSYKAFLHSHSFTGNPLACSRGAGHAGAVRAIRCAGRQPPLGGDDVGGDDRAVQPPPRHRHPPAGHDPGGGTGQETPRKREEYPAAERRGLRVYQYGLEKACCCGRWVMWFT